MSQRAAGQCSEWLDGPFDLNSPGADVEDMLSFDLDGGGPQPAQLVAATDTGVWVWDLVNWRPLGEGLTAASALGTFNGSLVAAADVGVGDWRVVRWNGNGWILMGGSFEFTGSSPEIRNLVVFSNSLFVGGGFTGVGGVPISHVARWNGSAWVAAGSGVVFTPRAMAVFDLDGAGPNAERMIVAGYTQSTFPPPLPFVFIHGVWAQWTGTEWEPPQKMGFGVRDLLVVGNHLYACGVDDAQNSVATSAVTGNWTGTTFGVATSLPLQQGSYMDRMAEWNGDLVVVGNFDFPGSDNVILRTTSPVGMLPLAGGRPGSSELKAVCAFGSNIAVANRQNDVAQCDMVNWTPVNSTGFGNAFATLGARLVVGGNFTRNIVESGVPRLAYNLVGWNGSAYSRVGGSTNGVVHALEGFVSGDDCLLVGGAFTRVGEGISVMNVNNIALRNEPLLIAATWSPMGNGFNAPVLAVDRATANQFHGDTIYAGGQFTAAGTGSPTFGRIAQWFGSPPAWSAMGSGFNNTVRAIKAYNSGVTGRIVVAGGDFTTAGGVAANRIASWASPALPPGPAWAPMGSGFNGPVLAIERYNSATYAAGAFTASGVVTVNRIALWQGTAWVPVGSGSGFNDTVRALLVHGGFLYAAGDFTSVNGTPVDHIARWNGSVWADAGSDADVPVLALGTYRGEIHAGLASDETSLRYLADAPWIAQQPLSQTVSCGQNVAFVCVPGPGYFGLTFTWRRNGVPVTEGPTGNGSSIELNVNTLTITNVHPLDAAGYSCVLSSAECGSTTSSTATLTVTGSCCPADIAPAGGDSAVNIDDLLTVINGWGSCPVPCPPRCAPDISPVPAGDCQTNINDLLEVINNWGPCP